MREVLAEQAIAIRMQAYLGTSRIHQDGMSVTRLSAVRCMTMVATSRVSLLALGGRCGGVNMGRPNRFVPRQRAVRVGMAMRMKPVAQQSEGGILNQH